MIGNKIVHLVNGGTSVGAITSIRKLATSLSKLGINVSLLSYNKHLDREDLDDAVESVYCDLRFNQVLNKYSNNELNKFFGLILLVYHFIYDVLKLNSFIRHNHVKVLHTHYLNDNFIACFTPRKVRKVSHIRSIANTKFLGGIGFKIYRKVIYSRSNLIIGISNTVLKVFNFPHSDKIIVLYNGIAKHTISADSNEENVLSRLQDINRNKIVIGTVTRFSKDKGLEFLLDIIKETTLDNYNIHFAIVAPVNNPKELAFKEFIVNKINALSIGDKVTIVGSFKKPVLFMPCFFLLVHPTLSREGFGNVVLEAHSFGVPVISTNCGGPSEIIENGHSGFIINQLDPKEFSRHINLLVNDSNLYNKFRAKALQISDLPRYNLEQSVTCLIEKYEMLCLK
ncbi:hypothetical protein N180_15350 [Pedobacter antarcticus 4BY]|uniref:Glycosyl transferase family 1 domain-containing protein n=2 Tax=Pedobacter antarcticus TaxID=34086 RepID=A0A081PE00_9SPHI|nr:glycosyltransferase [Pedobacter antarcticus]KEQ28923.1 hypothetical protein N180_15350 [Pedobacter antarcticus 4BY]SFF12956.1 Glycosyltransferase involved in cell wall bisynthesis [Pedobacter antarcticus]